MHEFALDVDPWIAPRARHRPEVLLIDAHEPTRAAVASALRADGYDVREAANGREMISSLGTIAPDAIGHTRPAVVVTVLRDGDAVADGLCRFLRHECSVPVVAVTAFCRDDPDARAARVGAVDTIGRPFDNEHLRVVVGIVARDPSWRPTVRIRVPAFAAGDPARGSG